MHIEVRKKNIYILLHVRINRVCKNHYAINSLDTLGTKVLLFETACVTSRIRYYEIDEIHYLVDLDDLML